MKKVIAFSVACCLIFSLNAYAKNVWDLAESDTYGEKAGGMFGRGLLNAATCFIDMPVQAVAGARENKPEFIGAVGGFAKGAVCTILRASSGIIDVATFWVPGFHGIPVSRSYENCLDFGGREERTAVAPVPSAYVPPPMPRVVQQPVAGAATTEDSRMKYVKK